MYDGLARSRKRSVAAVLAYSSWVRWSMPSDTRASRKSSTPRGCKPRSARTDLAVRGPAASTVNTPSSTALSNVFEPQKPSPSWRIPSGVAWFVVMPVIRPVIPPRTSRREAHGEGAPAGDLETWGRAVTVRSAIPQLGGRSVFSERAGRVGNQLCAPSGTRLHGEIGHVPFHGAGRQVQPAGDLLVGQPHGEQPEDFQLTEGDPESPELTGDHCLAAAARDGGAGLSQDRPARRGRWRRPPGSRRSRVTGAATAPDLPNRPRPRPRRRVATRGGGITGGR